VRVVQDRLVVLGGTQEPVVADSADGSSWTVSRLDVPVDLRMVIDVSQGPNGRFAAISQTPAGVVVLGEADAAPGTP
jgi:hypothetical protein